MEGKIARRAALTESCGCPAPAVRQAVVQPEPPAPPQAESSPRAGAVPAEAAARPSSDPRDQPAQNHVEVETPFVFSGNAAAIPGTVAKIQFSSLPNTVFTQEDPEPVVLTESRATPAKGKAEPTSSPTPVKKEKEKKGFMAKLRGLFGGLFHR